MMQSWDFVVIGGGVMGAAAAYALAAPGRSVLLLEQFAIGHMRGSSHGGSRIVRYAHPSREYATLMPEMFVLWRKLEADSGERLLLECGGLFIAPDDDPFLTSSYAAMTDLGMPGYMFSSTELLRDYPQFRVARDDVGLYDPHGGILAASATVKAMVRLAVAQGCSLAEHTKVITLEPVSSGARLVVESAGSTRTLFANRLIVCAGPWSSTLLAGLLDPPLPLRVTHQQVAYFAVDDHALWLPRRCPVYIFSAEPHVYGFPIFEQSGRIKVARELFDTVVDPDGERRIDSLRLADLSRTIAERFAGVDPSPLHADICLYTETPNRDFYIDRHPEFPAIVIAAGFSGRGFKFGAGFGQVLAHLAQSEPGSPPHRFWLPRFALGSRGNDGPSESPELFAR